LQRFLDQYREQYGGGRFPFLGPPVFIHDMAHNSTLSSETRAQSDELRLFERNPAPQSHPARSCTQSVRP
jgi:hypothetical protein